MVASEGACFSRLQGWSNPHEFKVDVPNLDTLTSKLRYEILNTVNER